MLEICPMLIVPKALSWTDNNSASLAYACPRSTSESASSFIFPIMWTKDRTCSLFDANSEQSLGRYSYEIDIVIYTEV